MNRVVSAIAILLFAANAFAACGCQDVAARPCQEETLASALAVKEQPRQMELTADVGTPESALGPALSLAVLFLVPLYILRRRRSPLILFAAPRRWNFEEPPASIELPMAA